MCGAGIVAGAPPLLANVAVPARGRGLFWYCFTASPCPLDERQRLNSMNSRTTLSCAYGPYMYYSRRSIDSTAVQRLNSMNSVSVPVLVLEVEARRWQLHHPN
eukprot:COSAG01_NODE_9441_length_2426_cov_3.862378_2_plen_103_part_00